MRTLVALLPLLLALPLPGFPSPCLLLSVREKLTALAPEVQAGMILELDAQGPELCPGWSAASELLVHELQSGFSG